MLCSKFDDIISLGNHIPVYDALDGLWVAKGLYDNAVEINESILFDNSDGKATLHILVVSVIMRDKAGFKGLNMYHHIH